MLQLKKKKTNIKCALLRNSYNDDENRWIDIVVQFAIFNSNWTGSEAFLTLIS